jgi:thiol-disulfide isomerase/thioredoxin
MKKLTTFLTLSILSIGINAQTENLLKSVADKLVSLQDYQTHCVYTFVIPYGGAITVEAEMITQKNEKDTLCGFYYSFKTKEQYKDVFGDFTLYFKQAVYQSYKGVVEVTRFSDNPEAFKYRRLSYGIVAPIHKSPQLFGKTPYQIGKLILATLKDENSNIICNSDTLIGNDSCLQFSLEVPNQFGGGTIYELAFHKQEFYPISVREKYYNNNKELSDQYTLTRYSNTKINSNLSSVFFNEENLLGRGWKTKTYKVSDSKTENLIGKQAPAWSLPILGKNDSLSSESLKGKFVLLEFTATWCGHCIEAAKFMNIVEETFNDSTNIAIISIFSNKYDKTENILSFVTKNNTISTVLYNAKNLEEFYYITGYPQFYLISPEGKILKSYPGYSVSFNEEILNFLKNI